MQVSYSSGRFIHSILIYFIFGVGFLQAQEWDFRLIGGDAVTAVVPNGISAEGSTVVGSATFGKTDEVDGESLAFRWRFDEPIAALGSVLGGTRSHANAASADGGIIVGGGRSGLGYDVGFRKTGDSPFLPVFDLNAENSNPTTDATGVSADGGVVVGFHRHGPLRFVRSFVWTPIEGGGGTFETLGELLPGTRRSSGQHWNRANAVSADGRYVVGWSDAAHPAGGLTEAYRYDRQSGTVIGLGFLPGGLSSSSAYAVSADGSVVVGTANSALDNQELFYWTEAEGMLSTGLVFTSGEVVRVALSGDGRYIVTSVGGRAARWSRSGGLEFIDDHVPQLLDWQFAVATGVNFDGSVIAGFGYPPEPAPTSSGEQVGWVVRITDIELPPAPPLPPLAWAQADGRLLLAFSGVNATNGWVYQVERSIDLAAWQPALRLITSDSNLDVQQESLVEGYQIDSVNSDGAQFDVSITRSSPFPAFYRLTWVRP